MDKKEIFKKQLIDARIFLEYKDEPIYNIEIFNQRMIKKYGKGNYRDVALKITNYQIEKYDTALHNIYEKGMKL